MGLNRNYRRVSCLQPLLALSLPIYILSDIKDFSLKIIIGAMDRKAAVVDVLKSLNCLLCNFVLLKKKLWGERASYLIKMNHRYT